MGYNSICLCITNPDLSNESYSVCQYMNVTSDCVMTRTYFGCGIFQWILKSKMHTTLFENEPIHYSSMITVFIMEAFICAVWYTINKARKLMLKELV